MTTHGDNAPAAGLNRRALLLSSGAAVLTSQFLASRSASAAAAASDLKFAASLGWTTFDSGRHLQEGFKAGVKELGGNLTMTDAGFDPKKQIEQIDALIATKPDVLLITPSDGVVIAPAVGRAIKAGIPVFTADSLVPGMDVVSTAMSNNFGMGAYAAEYIAKQLGGKGKIARVSLPKNVTWDQRTRGFESVMRGYPDIKVGAFWSYDFTAGVTPRQAMDKIIASHPDLDAIWCAWDGAAVDGVAAAKAADRPKMILTGIDGGSDAFKLIAAGTQLKLTLAQAFYEMSHQAVFNAHQLKAGKKPPRLIITPSYAVLQPMLTKGIPDDYDVTGRAAKLGWAPAALVSAP